MQRREHSECGKTPHAHQEQLEGFRMDFQTKKPSVKPCVPRYNKKGFFGKDAACSAAVVSVGAVSTQRILIA